MKTRKPKILVFEDVTGEWRWHLKATNGRILCQGESHPTKAKAERAAANVVRTCAAMSDKTAQ